MAWLDRFRRKEVSAESLGSFYSASVKAPTTGPLGRRPSMRDLAQRYGMLVHRCVGINAQTAASIKPRLFAIGNPSQVLKSSSLRAKSVDKKTLDYMAGRCGADPSTSVLRKSKGNFDNIVEIESHPFLDLIDDVNEWTEGYAFREAFYSDLQVFGRSFTLLVRDGKPQPTSMWRLLPQMMAVVPGKERFVSHFDYGTGADKVVYDLDDVFWVRVFDPSDPYGGVGPLEAWLQTVDSGFGNAAFVDYMYKRGGSPDYVLMAKGGMSTEQKRSFRGEFRRLFGRMVNRQDTVAIISGDAELKPLQRAPRELQTVEQEQYMIEAIAMAFGVPKSLLTTDDVNLANAREGSITHARNTILPMLRRFEDAVNQRLLPQWSDRLFLMHDNPVKEDREIRIKERASQLGAGYTVNEIRMADDLEPLDSPVGDMPMVASNLIPLGAPEPGQQAREIEEEVGKVHEDFVAKEAEDDELVTRQYSFTDAMAGLGCGCELKEQGLPDVYSPRYENEVQRILAKMIDEVIDALPKEKSLPGAVTMVKDYTDAVMSIDMDAATAAMFAVSHTELRKMVNESGSMEASDLTRQTGVEVAFDIDNTATLEAIDKMSHNVAKDVPKTASKDIRQRLRKNIARGGTIDELTKELTNMRRNRPDSWSRNRAKLVARTETAIAMNEGRLLAMKQSGVVKGKVFAPAPDACQLCRKVAADFKDKVINLDENLYNKGDVVVYASGKEFRFDYRNVTAGTIHPNCRCTVKSVPYSMQELAERRK